MTTPDLSTWISRADAAAALDCSEKTIDRLATAGRLQRMMRRRIGKKPEPVYHPGDIDREQLARVRPHLLPPSQDTSHQALAVAAQETHGALELLERLLRPPATERKLWLTLPEASAISGLSSALLRRLIRSNALPAIRDRALKVRLADIESLQLQDLPALRPRTSSAP